MSHAMPMVGDRPPSSVEGYNQTYIVLAHESEMAEAQPKSSDSEGGGKDADLEVDGKEAEAAAISTAAAAVSHPVESRQVLFRCGNWCYKGRASFPSTKFTLKEIPRIVPALQRQQNKLKYYCLARSVPRNSIFSGPMNFLYEASTFISEEVTSDRVCKELDKWSSVFTWIQDDSALTYFELQTEIPACMRHVKIAASKTYHRGVITIVVYHEGTFYFVLQGGEGDQALLDLRFPDVSHHGQGLHIHAYNDHLAPWRKLTLWHSWAHDRIDRPRVRLVNLSSDSYVQTYCILAPTPVGPEANSSDDPGGRGPETEDMASVQRDVLFRFGSWCYGGRVQLSRTLNLADVPYVIPALRVQQSRLDYLCDAGHVPSTSPFVAPLEYISRITPIIEQEITGSETVLAELIERLNRMGLGAAVEAWLDGDSRNSFFEFQCATDEYTARIFDKMDLIASKCYHASGVVTIMIVFQNTIYVSVLDGSNENPLLDSHFPDVSAKGRGYQIGAYSEGVEGWPQLRKVSIWQTVAALEKEFVARAGSVAAAKSQMGSDAADAADKVERHQEELLERELKGGDRSDDESGMEDEEDSEADERREQRPEQVGSPAGRRDELEDDSAEVLVYGGSQAKDGDVDTDDRRLQDEEAARGRSKRRHKSKKHKRKIGGSSASGTGVGAGAGPSMNDADQGSDPSAKLAPLSQTSVAAPHHLPGGDTGLQSRLEEIRKQMGDQGMAAPWDARGRPLGQASSLGSK